MHRLPLALLAASLVGLLVVTVAAPLSCSDPAVFIDAGPPDGVVFPDLPVVDAYVNPCAPDPPPTVTGKVLAPNGVDPVAGASVGVPIALDPLPAAVRCETCAVTGRFSAQTYSAADGSFRLEGVPNTGHPFLLSIQKGYFRRVIEVSVPPCGEVALPAAQSTLPGANGQYGDRDTVPKIAVITGAWDRLEKVLEKLGVSEKVFFNGRDLGTGPGSAQALLQNGALLKQHHMLFINCGVVVEDLVEQPGPVRNNLRSYVRGGGRLFVTDYSYDFVEQVFPEFIDFQGSHDGDWEQAEEPDQAEKGAADLTLEAEVLDDQMRAWLALPEIGALLPNQKVSIKGFQTTWAMQREVAAEGKVWVRGPVRGIGVPAGTVRPLTASYDFHDDDKKGCGRVIFSSYHTFGEEPVLLPQERILEYLMLEIGGCVTVK